MNLARYAAARGASRSRLGDPRLGFGGHLSLPAGADPSGTLGPLMRASPLAGLDDEAGYFSGQAASFEAMRRDEHAAEQAAERTRQLERLAAERAAARGTSDDHDDDDDDDDVNGEANNGARASLIRFQSFVGGGVSSLVSKRRVESVAWALGAPFPFQLPTLSALEAVRMAVQLPQGHSVRLFREYFGGSLADTVELLFWFTFVVLCQNAELCAAGDEELAKATPEARWLTTRVCESFLVVLQSTYYGKYRNFFLMYAPYALAETVFSLFAASFPLQPTRRTTFGAQFRNACYRLVCTLLSGLETSQSLIVHMQQLMFPHELWNEDDEAVTLRLFASKTGNDLEELKLKHDARAREAVAARAALRERKAGVAGRASMASLAPAAGGSVASAAGGLGAAGRRRQVAQPRSGPRAGTFVTAVGEQGDEGDGGAHARGSEHDEDGDSGDEAEAHARELELLATAEAELVGMGFDYERIMQRIRRAFTLACQIAILPDVRRTAEEQRKRALDRELAKSDLAARRSTARLPPLARSGKRTSLLDEPSARGADATLFDRMAPPPGCLFAVESRVVERLNVYRVSPALEHHISAAGAGSPFLCAPVTVSRTVGVPDPELLAQPGLEHHAFQELARRLTLNCRDSLAEHSARLERGNVRLAAIGDWAAAKQSDLDRQARALLAEPNARKRELNVEQVTRRIVAGQRAGRTSELVRALADELAGTLVRSAAATVPTGDEVITEEVDIGTGEATSQSPGAADAAGIGAGGSDTARAVAAGDSAASLAEGTGISPMQRLRDQQRRAAAAASRKVRSVRVPRGASEATRRLLLDVEGYADQTIGARDALTAPRLRSQFQRTRGLFVSVVSDERSRVARSAAGHAALSLLDPDDLDRQRDSFRKDMVVTAASVATVARDVAALGLSQPAGAEDQFVDFVEYSALLSAREAGDTPGPAHARLGHARAGHAPTGHAPEDVVLRRAHNDDEAPHAALNRSEVASRVGPRTRVSWRDEVV